MPGNLRLYSSRDDGNAQLAAGETRSIQVLPAETSPESLVLHVGVINATQIGGSRMWPAGTDEPLVDQMNFSGSDQASRLEVLQPGTNGQINIHNVSSAPVDIVIDIQGWFTVTTDPANIGVIAEPDGWLEYTNTLSSQLALLDPATTTVTGTTNADGTCAIAAQKRGWRAG